MDFVGPLGQPSELCVEENLEETKKKKIVFIAGGVGTAPIYPQVKWLKEHGVETTVIMGSRTKDLLFYVDEMREVATQLCVTTDDGSYGFHGMGTNQLQALVDEGQEFNWCVAIGPMIMMKFVCKLTKELGIPTIVSMNPIMLDGTGMCGACRLVVGDQVKFACVDGPSLTVTWLILIRLCPDSSSIRQKKVARCLLYRKVIHTTADADIVEVTSNG